MINSILENDIEFIENYQGSYIDFNDLAEVEDFCNYEEIDGSVSNSTDFIQDKKLCNRTVKLNAIVNLLIELVITPHPNFSVDEDNSNTDISTPLPGNDWVQQSITVTNSNVDGNSNHAEITISGYILVGIKVDSFSKGIKLRKHIIVRVNKTDGKIYYSEVKNIN